MKSKSVKEIKLKNYFLETCDTSKTCKTSKASSEIMLHRIYEGKAVEFPFAQKLCN